VDTLSKAFLKSIYTTSNGVALSCNKVHSLKHSINWVPVDLLGTHPCCSEQISLFVCKNVISWSLITVSITLLQTQVSDMGL